MKRILGNILRGINPAKVIEAIKGNDIQVKSIKSIAGWGTLLLTSGISALTEGVVNKDWFGIVGGAVLIAAWLFTVERMGSKISEIK